MNIIIPIIDRCRSTPDSIALVEEQLLLSYQELENRIKLISSILKNRPQPCQRVAIALDRGIDAVTAIMGTLHAGMCYVPLDINNPGERLAFITEDADVQCVIGHGGIPSWLKNEEQWLDIQQLQTVTDTAQVTHVDAETLAVILYTSGSTGTPKGVALSHRALLNFSQWARQTFRVTATDRIASLAPFYFDLSIFDLFTSLSTGARVQFIPSLLTLSPSRLSTWLAEERISIWYTVPSILSFIAFKGALEQIPLPKLKTILFAGEVFPTPHLIRLCEQLPKVRLYNLYGPTETNVCCYWPVDRKRLQADQPIPIGNSACGAALKIDPHTGELQVKGANNLSGYWQRGHLLPALSHDGWYATGDRVSLNEQEEYCYHGRLDRMLKCSGYRIEPAEIEAVLNQIPAVKQSAVMGIEGSSSGQRPAAAVILIDDITLTDIVKYLKMKLPHYMQPSKIIIVKEFPLLANGKMDYVTLASVFKNPDKL